MHVYDNYYNFPKLIRLNPESFRSYFQVLFCGINFATYKQLSTVHYAFLLRGVTNVLTIK